MRHSIESESCGETDELQRYRRSADRLEEAYKKIRKLEDTAARSRGRLANSIECARLSDLRARGDHACSHQYHNGKPTSGISFRLRSPEVLQMEDDVVVRLSSKSMRFDGSRFFGGGGDDDGGGRPGSSASVSAKLVTTSRTIIATDVRSELLLDLRYAIPLINLNNDLFAITDVRIE